jgi:hypothetical protein
MMKMADITKKSFFAVIFVTLCFIFGCNAGDPYIPANPVGLSIVKVSPTENQNNVAVNSRISVTFEKDIDISSLNERTFSLGVKRTGTTANGKISYDTVTKTATIEPYFDLAEGSLYEIIVSGVKGAQNEFVPPHIFSFRTSAPFLVERINPANEAKSVKVLGIGKQEIFAIFNESVKFSEITTANFYAMEQGKTDISATGYLDASVEYDDTLKKLTLKPRFGRLHYSTNYFVTLRDIVSVTNGRIDNVTWLFETEEIRVAASEPSNGSSGISTGTDIKLHFQLPVNKDTISGGVVLRKYFGSQQPFLFQEPPTFSMGDMVVNFKTKLSDADTGLENGTTYEIVVDGVSTMLGETFKSFRATFTTTPF